MSLLTEPGPAASDSRKSSGIERLYFFIECLCFAGLLPCVVASFFIIALPVNEYTMSFEQAALPPDCDIVFIPLVAMVTPPLLLSVIGFGTLWVRSRTVLRALGIILPMLSLIGIAAKLPEYFRERERAGLCSWLMMEDLKTPTAEWPS